MTTSVRIVCTGNTEGDSVSIYYGHARASHADGRAHITLERGEVSQMLAAGPAATGQDLWIHITGIHGDGEPRGELAVVVKERTDEVRRASQADLLAEDWELAQ